MKIDGNSPNANVRPLGPSPDDTRINSGTSGAQKANQSSHGDTVELSSQAQLVGRTLKAAEAEPAIRQDKVDQAKQKLAAGEVGNDPVQLANRLIDHLLEG